MCAGKIVNDKEVLTGLIQLEERGQAKIIDKYVTDKEEELCFSACDSVLLPYVKHFGSSGVLSRAAAAGKMMIWSDFDLVGKRILENKLGLLFKSENSDSLGEKMLEALNIDLKIFEKYNQAAISYADTCSFDAFKNALLKPFLSSNRKS